MELMSGNEAIAQGAWEAGCTIGVAYPGTPSTETLEAFAKKEGVYAEWCVNEKVAVEVGIGASAAGARVLATMKHVGVNVAADPLFTAAYTGVGGGMVILAADDPGMYSSQNEQDSHYYAQAAAIPCLDPADSAEALRFTREAYDISERFDVPVIIRSSVRISHTKTPVEAGERAEAPARPYEKNPAKWVMMPAFAKPRRLVQLDRIDKLRQWVETCPYNEVIEGKGTVGVVCAGAAYQHVAEALPDASIFKLGVTWPLPAAALRDFADSVEAVYVVEEGSEYLKDAVRACGVPVSDTPCPLPRAGELSPGLVRAAFGLEQPSHAPAATDLPGRPPALCPGCPHRLVFKELSRMRAIVTGDIGCYTLAAYEPLYAIETCECMGASVSSIHGFNKALGQDSEGKTVAVLGDSTFMHSGMTGLANIAYNQSNSTVIILDNSTTGMTGHQQNPTTGKNLRGDPAGKIDLETLCRAMGIRRVRVVDPYDLKATEEVVTEELAAPEPSVIITRRPCVLLRSVEKHPPYQVEPDKCKGCKMCMRIGCPAISWKDKKAVIDPTQCVGCGVCEQLCKFDAFLHC